jgi:protein-disulfide isomerase
MFRKSRLTLILIVISLFWPLPMRSSDDAPGQILGGSANSPVQIEVFSDFQCSACREFYLNTIRQVLQEYSSKDKVCVVYHEFPLAIHRYSREAARYSEAAARLGAQKLLSVMDSLFMDQALWAQDGKVEMSVSKAKALSPEDLLKLKKVMQDSSIDLAIERELQLGIKNEIKSTPTMFISYIGKKQKVEGLVTYLVLKQFIDSIVK